jgi:hypothetical protein
MLGGVNGMLMERYWGLMRFNGVLMEGCLRDLNRISIGFSPPISVVLFVFGIKKE